MAAAAEHPSGRAGLCRRGGGRRAGRAGAGSAGTGAGFTCHPGSRLRKAAVSGGRGKEAQGAARLPRRVERPADGAADASPRPPAPGEERPLRGHGRDGSHGNGQRGPSDHDRSAGQQNADFAADSGRYHHGRCDCAAGDAELSPGGHPRYGFRASSGAQPLGNAKAEKADRRAGKEIRNRRPRPLDGLPAGI